MTESPTANQPLSGSVWVPDAVVIEGRTPEIPGVWTYDLRFAAAERGAAYGFRPGQFNMLYLPGVGEIPISLSASPASRHRWAHTIRTAGRVTRALALQGLGCRLGLRGPFGSAWPLAAIEGADVLLVGGGIGLAPLRPAVYYLLENRPRYGRLRLLYGARQPSDCLFAQEFEAWRQGGMEIDLVVDRPDPGWQGQIGVVTSLLDRLPWLQPSATALLGCGPEAMMKYVVRSALTLGIGLENIWLSLERNMQCAAGLCGHCQLGPLFICADGPIFRCDRVATLWSVEEL